MPLVKPTPPTDVSAAINDGFLAFSIGSNTGIQRQGDVAQPPIMPAASQAELPIDAQAVYVLNLADAATIAGTAAAAPAGWRFFAGNTAPKLVLGWISRPDSSGKRRVTAAYTGDRVWAGYEAMANLALLPELQAHNYELRILMAPALNLEAFWLVSQDAGAPDLIAPFASDPMHLIPGLRTQPVYTMADFIAIVRPAALLLRHTCRCAGPGT